MFDDLFIGFGRIMFRVEKDVEYVRILVLVVGFSSFLSFVVECNFYGVEKVVVNLIGLD